METFFRTSNQVMLCTLIIMVMATVYSTAVLEIGSYLIFLLFLIGGQWKEKLKLIKSSHITIAALVLFAYICLRLIGSDGSMHEGLKNVSAYSKLLLIPVVLWIMHCYPIWQNRLLNFFLGALIISLTYGYIKHFSHYKLPFDYTPDFSQDFIGHIALSFFAALGCYIYAVKLIFNWKKKTCAKIAFNCILITFFWYYLFFISIGRSGYISFYILFIYLILKLASPYKKYLISAFVLLMIVIATFTAFHHSKVLKKRVYTSLRSAQNFHKHKYVKYSTSERLTYLKYAFNKFKERPITGYGTGSYKEKYHLTYHKKLEIQYNPLNQYLYFGVELGTPGILLFMGLLFFGLRYKYPKTTAINQKIFYLEGFILVFGIGCLINSWLHDVHEGYLAMILIPALTPIINSKNLKPAKLKQVTS